MKVKLPRVINRNQVSLILRLLITASAPFELYCSSRLYLLFCLHIMFSGTYSKLKRARGVVDRSLVYQSDLASADGLLARPAGPFDKSHVAQLLHLSLALMPTQ